MSAVTILYLLTILTKEDALFGCLTVRETFQFVAALTCPQDMLPALREARVDEVMHVLGLKVCENVLIGNIVKKGISGGQKRLVKSV